MRATSAARARGAAAAAATWQSQAALTSKRAALGAGAMSDFNPGPTYRGDPGVPHANENNFTVRVPRGLGAAAAPHSSVLRTQAFMGGLWVVLGLQFCKEVIEVRPLHRRVARAAPQRRFSGSRLSPPGSAEAHRASRRRSPDHVMAVCEEAFKRKQRARGQPYTGKLPVRPAAPRLTLSAARRLLLRRAGAAAARAAYFSDAAAAAVAPARA